MIKPPSMSTEKIAHFHPLASLVANNTYDVAHLLHQNSQIKYILNSLEERKLLLLGDMPKQGELFPAGNFFRKYPGDHLSGEGIAHLVHNQATVSSLRKILGEKISINGVDWGDMYRLKEFLPRGSSIQSLVDGISFTKYSYANGIHSYNGGGDQEIIFPLDFKTKSLDGTRGFAGTNKIINNFYGQGNNAQGEEKFSKMSLLSWNNQITGMVRKKMSQDEWKIFITLFEDYQRDPYDGNRWLNICNFMIFHAGIRDKIPPFFLRGELPLEGLDLSAENKKLMEESYSKIVDVSEFLREKCKEDCTLIGAWALLRQSPKFSSLVRPSLSPENFKGEWEKWNELSFHSLFQEKDWPLGRKEGQPNIFARKFLEEEITLGINYPLVTGDTKIMDIHPLHKKMDTDSWVSSYKGWGSPGNSGSKVYDFYSSQNKFENLSPPSSEKLSY